MDQDYSLIGILKTLYKWIKPIAYATIGITILSAIVLLLLPNYYQASTQFYAGHPDLSQPAPVGSSSDRTTYIYGTDNDLDRLFSISTSSELYKYLIDKFDLYNHYDIDPEGKKAQAKIRLRLSKLYQTLKTEYGAINLTVEDQDPVLARDMANEARDKINELSQKMVKASQLKTINSFDENLKEKQIKSIMLNDSLSRVKGRYEIYNSKSQGEVYAELITNTIVDKLTQELSRLNDQISLDKERKRQLEASYNVPYSALLVVEVAETPIDKSRPKRTILLAMIGLITLVLSILIAFLLENYRKINWDQIKS